MKIKKMLFRNMLALVAAVIMILICSFTSNAEGGDGLTQTEYGFVYTYGEVSTKHFQSSMANYCLIPENVRENFQLAGWKLIVTSEELEDRWFPGMKYVNAGISFEHMEIRLEDTKKGANAVIHEVGHYVFYCLDADMQNRWLSIWERDAANTSKYAQANYLEGFAEAFDLAVRTPSAFSKNCPDSYNFVMEACGSLQGIEE